MPVGEPPFYWDLSESLAEGRWPTRVELDEAATRNPFSIRPIWGFWRHAPPLVSVAHSAALKLAGITRETAPPHPSATNAGASLTMSEGRKGSIEAAGWLTWPC